jgi:manganese/iron transport system ATP-binding protein/manganese/zinc/iron transport system ATP- binding protein
MISTHDLSLAAAKFDRVLLLNHRLVAFGAPQEVLTQPNLSKAFGAQLLLLPDGTALIDDH